MSAVMSVKSLPERKLSLANVDIQLELRVILIAS